MAEVEDQEPPLEEGPQGPSEDLRERGRSQGEALLQGGQVVAGAGAATPLTPPGRRRGGRRLVGNVPMALVFLAPALVLLGALVLYPIVFSVVRSFYDRAGDAFIGVDNYDTMVTSDRTQRAIRNNLIWVVVAPTLATGIGLIYAVLVERVRWQTAFKVAVFMPMAISALATGVIFRLVYENEPDRGLANAVVTSVVDTFQSSGQYEGARPSGEGVLEPEGDALVTAESFAIGDTAALGLLAIQPDDVPDGAVPASEPEPSGDGLAGVVWLDFTRGGGGERGVVDESELGLPGVQVEALSGGDVAASTSTDDDGSFTFGDDLDAGDYRLRLAASNFEGAYGGVNWLGGALVTPAVIAAWLWIWIGFAMIVIGAGLAALPREVIEAARVDGASEWKVFRKVTAPLLIPVLLVVFVTLIINVLKIFDLVFIIPPGSEQENANVLALEMWRVSFGGANDQGLGSALSVFLFLLVLPAMYFNVRRLRSERR